MGKIVPLPRPGLFYVGHIKPTKRRQPRPCHDGSHVGPLVNTAVYNRFGGVWAGMGECAACRSTVHKSQIRPRAA